MFTAETLDTTWKQMQEYERDHFGLRFGDDFGLIAAILRANKSFMSLGGIMSMLASLEMSSRGKEMQTADESRKKELINDMMEKPSSLHNTLAELFYLGYQMGKREKEVEVLGTMMTSSGA